MDYAIGHHSLKCISCGEATPIAVDGMDFTAHDYAEAERIVPTGDANVVTHEIHCNNCGADFSMPNYVHADECPYCDMNLVVPVDLERYFKPDGVLPFEVDHNEAVAGFKKWLHGLWFAPNALKKKAIQATPINASYMPFWTFDADTFSKYHGSRGDNYVTTVRRNGQTQTVVKTRWRSVSGSVSVPFDDLTVLATKSLPLKFQSFLSQWNLGKARQFDGRYLSGFHSELYTIELTSGFELAKQVMDGVIRGRIRIDIGGDHQIISSVQTQYNNVGFQLVLAPVYISAFNYNKKTYRYVINGQSGKAYGERPWSWWKIGGLIFMVATIVATWYAFSQ